MLIRKLLLYGKRFCLIQYCNIFYMWYRTTVILWSLFVFRKIKPRMDVYLAFTFISYNFAIIFPRMLYDEFERSNFFFLIADRRHYELERKVIWIEFVCRNYETILEIYTIISRFRRRKIYFAILYRKNSMNGP